jgi:MFS family permease
LVAIFVTPLIGLLADRTQRHRFVLGLAAFTKGIAAPLMLLSNAWLWLTTMVSLRVISAGAHDAILNRLTLARLKENHSQKLGSVRFWGSLSFAATSMLAGMVARGRSVAVLFPLAGVLGAVAVFFVGAFPAQMAERQSVRALRERLPKRSPHLLLLLLIIFLFTFGRSGPETFAYVFLAEDLGAGNDLIGILGALTWLAALPAYYVADWLLRRWGSVFTMAISFSLYILGWGGYALIPRPALALPLAALEGFGQALYLVSMVILLSQLDLRERAAIDQMLAQLTVPGLARMIAQPVSGWLFDTLGGRSLFAFDTVVVLLTVGLLLARANRLETASLSHRQQKESK